MMADRSDCQMSQEREKCKHSYHIVLNKGTVFRFCPTKVNLNVFWNKAAAHSIKAKLKKHPVRFQYGTSCFSTLAEKAQQVTFPTIQSILSVGSGEGVVDFYIATVILGTGKVYLTDLEPPNNLVERLSCLDAIAKYGDVTALMFTFPSFLASGYQGVIEKFKGDYIVLIGEVFSLKNGDIVTLGHTDPDKLLDQILQRFEEVNRLDISPWCDTLCLESMVVYRRKNI